jgi:signal transduction histidine kinase/ActR/RegA family two-component response regulator
LRDAFLAALITFVCSAVGLSIVYARALDAQMDGVQRELLQLARTTALQVDGDLHHTFTSPAREGTPDHRRALAPLINTHRAAMDIVDVYTGVMIDGRIYWVLDSRFGSPPSAEDGAADPIMTEYKDADPVLLQVFATQTPGADTELRRDEQHAYMSAFAPFFDRAGKFTGVVGVDMVLDAVDGRMASIRSAFAAALAAVSILSLVAGAVALHLRRVSADIVKKLRAAHAQAEANEAEAQAAGRAKTSFLAMMSHEIRTPMNGILGVADLLRGMSPDPKQRKLLNILAASGESLLRIINDILDFSKIEAERLELRTRPFELRGLLEELEHLLGPQAHAKQVRLIVDAADDLPLAVDGDRQRLAQVLMNLGTNAVKFTDRGEVRIGVRLLESVPGRARLAFQVRDTGIGIEPEALGHLFTPFVQLADAARHRGGGTGLGLVIAQKLVNLMGGAIRVETGHNQGSCFSFTIDLPLADAIGTTSTNKMLRFHGLSILVAEDNSVNQTIVDAMLRQLGHIPTLVANGREALAALARGDFDLVLMDCNMPVLGGIEATQLLRAGSAGARNPRIPVIALTANAMEGDRETCLAAGMDDFVAKPVNLGMLRAAIERAGKPEPSGAGIAAAR